jgi:hypothetical protein
VRALVAGLAVVGSLVSACAALPDANEAPRLSQARDGRGTTFTLEPWAYDVGAAFLCLDDPSDEFNRGRVPPAAAGCVELPAVLASERLTARFAPAELPAPLARDFLGSGPPWFLAVSGARGISSERLVMSIEDSPIPSDAGPS